MGTRAGYPAANADGRAGVNRWIGSGVIRSVSCRYTQTGKAYAWMSLAAQDDHGHTDFLDVVAWAEVAERVRDFARQDDRAEVTGKVHRRSYTSADGVTQYKTEIVADAVWFIDRHPPQKVKEDADG